MSKYLEELVNGLITIEVSDSEEIPFTARIGRMGLTAYGKTEDEAIQRVKRMFGIKSVCQFAKRDLDLMKEQTIKNMCNNRELYPER